ncbi:hypothetical protein X975_19448, partial [Stegodyphus mimosarum]
MHVDHLYLASHIISHCIHLCFQQLLLCTTPNLSRIVQLLQNSKDILFQSCKICVLHTV